MSCLCPAFSVLRVLPCPALSFRLSCRVLLPLGPRVLLSSPPYRGGQDRTGYRLNLSWYLLVVGSSTSRYGRTWTYGEFPAPDFSR